MVLTNKVLLKTSKNIQVKMETILTGINLQIKFLLFISLKGFWKSCRKRFIHWADLVLR